jgi:hypothetical protein
MPPVNRSEENFSFSYRDLAAFVDVETTPIVWRKINQLRRLPLTLREKRAAVAAPWRPKKEMWEPACKPGSVENSHSSGTHVAVRLERPTRKLARAARRGRTRSASLFGLAPSGVYRAANRYRSRGALLPHLFTLAVAARGPRLGGMFSVALSVGSRPPGVTWHPALWSPDFPPRRSSRSDCPADSHPAIVHTRRTPPAQSSPGLAPSFRARS